MYLSSIDLFGFKSFAQRTHIGFLPGVTAIVGPNGCGKSNLVDAIRWVLGEQRETALRSERMENVIFGGTAKRRPLGLAEISLTLHDNDGMLPLEYNEVTITRRLFRSGKSEYLLNKSICRLKDIVDLFMDTGLSPESYSIIELKMVEGIVTEDPSEMRTLLDEATGITRYKYRRREALRRLEEARQDRERARDILAEVETQASNLKRQVGKLRAYRKLQEKARYVRVVLILNRLKLLEAQLQPLDQSFMTLQLTMSASAGDLQGTEAEILRIESGLGKLETERQKDSLDFQQVEVEFQVKSQEKARLEEAIRLGEWQQSRNSDESETNHAELSRIEESIKLAEAALTHTAVQLPTLEVSLREREAAFQQVDREFRAARARAAQARENLNQVRGKETEAIRSTEQRKASISSLIARLAELNFRREELEKTLHKKNSELTSAEQEQKEKSKDLVQVRNRFADTKERIEALRARLHETERELAAAEGQRKQIALQIQHFGELHRRSSPLYSAGGAIADRFPQSVSAALADELQTETKYVNAVETALQGLAYARVVGDKNGFDKIVAYLRAEQAGRAALLLGSPPQDDLIHITKFIQQTNGQSLAQVIEGSSASAVWIRYLIRNVALLPSLGDLLQFAGLAAELGVVLVTLDGEFCDGKGIWIVGSSPEVTAISTGVSNQLGKLSQQAQETEAHIKALEDRVGKLRRDLTGLEHNLNSTEEELQHSEQLAEVARTHKLNLEAQVVSSKLLLDQIRSEIAEIPKSIEEISSAEQAETQEFADVLTEVRSLEQVLDQEVAAEATVMEQRELLRQAFAEEQIRVERARLEVHRAQDRLTDLQNRSRRLIDQIATLEQAQQQLSTNQAKLLQNLETQRIGVTESGATVQELRLKIEEIDLKRRDLLEAQRSGSSRARALRLKLEELSDSMHKLQLDRVAIEATLQEERRKIPDGLNLEELSGQEADSNQLADLERRILAMEPLNMAAEDEFRERQQRLDFLNHQLQDLEDAQSSLQQTVVTLNKEARERFTLGFERILTNFQKIFIEVFEGGQANLKLIEDDPLESRIEILANPGGKKIGSLALLSGGEKAMTAIALLFAIYMEKPSPFCVLDEVDAPLDDLNTRRFCHLLERFTPNTQFLVVTHNKRTMEVASNLLGVTMEEEGITRVVPVQIEVKA